MRRVVYQFSILVILGLVLGTCGGSEAEKVDRSDPVAYGEELYNGTPIGAASSPGCITCHSLEEDVTIVGPSHASLAIRAASAVPEQSADEYLRESIVNPDAHITDGFKSGTMYSNYGKELSEEEIDALVAYMLTLK